MNKRFAYLMACNMVLAQLPGTRIAANVRNDYMMESAKASLEVTLNLGYPVSEYDKLNLKAEILPKGTDEVVQTLSLDKIQDTQKSSTHYAIFEDLDLGSYEVRISGDGYTTYISEPMELIHSDKHLVVNSGSQVFTIGDVNADGIVGDEDLAELEKALGTNNEKYDLNKDNIVDIEDLSQMYWNKMDNGSKGEVKTFNTRMILKAVLDEEAIKQELVSVNKDTVTVSGEITSLFDGSETTTVSLESETPITEENPVVIPVGFKEAVPVSQISITAPADNGPKSGFVVYVDENGKTQRIPFSSENTSTVARYSKTNSKVITINLGKQIPIQKITIEVTETEKEGGLLAAISKIEFMEDVVDTSINQEQGIIKNLVGRPLNEGALLTWNETANVTGYKVSYGTEPGVYTNEIHTKTNSVEIEGLENGTTYYFAVQAVNGSWEGPKTGEISVVPESQEKPSVPTNVNVQSFDRGIKVTYRTGDDATGANIYYKKVTDNEYQKVEKTYSGQIIKGLENDSEYMVYVVATNSSGESNPSEVLKATPTEEEIIIPEIPTLNRIDHSHIVDIQMIDPRNVNTYFYPEGYTPKNLIDNDFTTHWTARTYQESRGFIATFDQPYEMDYVAVTSRLDTDLNRYDGTKKYSNYPDRYSIKVWETLDSEPIQLTNQASIPVRKNGLFLLPFERMQVAKIEVEVFEWHGAGAISLSEVMFYEAHDMVEKIDDIFSNGTHTELKDGIDEAYITELEAELNNIEDAVLWVDEDILRAELQAARDILTSGKPSNLGEMVEVIQTYQRSSAQLQNFAADGLSDLQATGVMAHAGEEILVYVDAPNNGNLPELVVSQFYGDGSWSKTITLEQGRNIINVPPVVDYNGQKGGSLYVTYKGDVQDTTTVRIVNATSIPTLELTSLDETETTKSAVREYVTELNTYIKTLSLLNKEKNPANSTEIGTDKVLLSLPAQEVHKGISNGIEDDIEAQTERLHEALLTWDENMKLHYNILGLSEDAENPKDRYPESRLNVRYMPMNNGVFMYASGDHVGIQYSSGASLVNATRDSVNGYFGWGINHEIGHIINDQNFVIGEVTNNIFSLFAQTINGGKSRLETSDMYEKIYEKVTSKDKGMAGNVFITLGMFWQLHLAYDHQNADVLPEDFYPKLHKLSRESNFSDVDTLNYFVRLASDTVEKDLTPFFERWGVKITPETYAYTDGYDKEDCALYYLNDEAMRYRLNGGAGMETGSTADVSVTVEQSGSINDTVVRLDLSTTMSQDALLGYEIYRDGEIIAFTTESEFTDDISANNVTHTYSVVAYDKLLNTTEKVSTDEVYIRTDHAILKSEYTVERTTAGALQITLPNVPEVVGMKFKDVVTSEDMEYTIEISQDGDDWTVAKEGILKSGSTILYYNKPGASSEDDRIWTYDAKYIRVTGKDIGELTDEQIDILAYPGDAVFFTEGAIGRLGSDYYFNGELIEEGTLVVMGSYRGHPVYSKIVLSAHYVDDKDFDQSERPGYSNENTVEAVEGELYMFAELPEDNEISKVGNGIWLFVPSEQELPAQIKANMFRTDEAESTEGGRLVSDTKWLIVPAEDDMPIIELS